ncbi:MAG TPA: ATP-binding protein [Polyangiaceae bacterium]
MADEQRTSTADMPAGLDVGVLGRSMLDAAKAAHIGVSVTFVDGLRPQNVYVSETAAELLGWTVAELLEGDPMTNIAPEDIPRMHERVRSRARGEVGGQTDTIHAIAKDGRRIPIEIATSNVVIDGRQAVFAFFFDARERMAADAERSRYEARFRELIERAPEPIGIIRDGYFIYANRAWIDALGYGDAPSLYAVPLVDLLGAEENAIGEGRASAVMERKHPAPPFTYHVKRRDGSVVLLEVTSVYLDYEGKPAVLSMARDVTARKKLEMQLVQADRLAALGTLAAGVAHEINNPLAYVILNLEWVLRKLPDSVHDAASVANLLTVLEEARQGAHRVSTIVRELRSFSRADDERRRRVDLVTVVEAAIKITGHEIRHRAHVYTSFERVRPIWANEGRLEQVLINLLMNAAQAMPEARAERNEIRVYVRPDAEGRAVLEVSDNGEGVPPDVLSRIFDPFFTTKPVGVGTGLGLSICHGIVSSLGGHIAVYSEPGRGATFRVVLPTSDAADDDAPPSPVPPAVVAATGRLRILVIDDEQPIANTMRDLLGMSHDVVVATSAWEALARVRAGAEFDVVFCDLMMPGLSGVDLYERFRSLRKGFEQKIVFMTGGAFTPRASEFLEAVDNRRIEKPFTFDIVERLARQVAAENRTR